MSESDQGKFSTDIAQDLIEQAVRSVERHTRKDGAEGVPIDDPATEEVATLEAPGGELEELRAQLDLSQAKGREMMEKLKDTHDRMLRAVADLDNYKKRAAKERDEVQRFGAERLLKDLLPVLDNLDRALEHTHGAGDFESLRQGVAMTRKLFEDALGKNGVRAFASLGKPFDPNFHEAMQQVEKADLPPNHVAAEILRGFTLNDRLVRPALVMVSKAPAPKDGTAPAENKEQDEAP